MNVIDKSEAGQTSRAIDFDRFRLRRFIDGLAGSSELDIRSEPVELAGIAEVLEGNSKAVLFRAAGPERAELVGCVMGGRNRLAKAFGVKPDGLLAEIQRRLKNRPEIVEVSRAEAPCQQVVLTEEDADLTRLPVHLQHRLRRRPLHFGVDRLRRRSEDRLDQRRTAPADAALADGGRRRPRGAERPARHL